MLTNQEIADREREFALWTNLADRYLTRGTITDALECLTRAVLVDSGDAPCSRYGTYARHFAPVAALASLVMTDQTGELSPEGHNGIVGLVVNDHEDPAYLIVSYGETTLNVLGQTVEDFLDDSTIELARETINAQAGE